MDTQTARPSRPKSRQSIAHIPPNSAVNDGENITADVSSMQRTRNPAPRADRKKSRSKSLGPGGLEALNEGARSSVKPSPAFPIKSILKPAIPLTPPKAIPTFDETRKRSTVKSKGQSPTKNDIGDLLIDFSTPAPNTNVRAVRGPIDGAENVLDPFSPITRSKSPTSKTVAVRTEEEQETAVREREAEERRRSEKQAILEQRAARRKSMANRRVSFAPEATLHTWNVVELVEDSTTSSTSNSTRRQSSMTSANSPFKTAKSAGLDAAVADTPSTPPTPTGERLVKASPVSQQDTRHKKRRRRSSVVPPKEDISDEVFSSSPFGGNSVADAESSPIRVEDSINSDDDDDDGDIDTEGDTAMVEEEGTSQSVASDASGSSTQSSLDERLRRAATQAGTRGIEYDENGDDLSMELATGTVTHAFQPWIQKGLQMPVENRRAVQDQENINPFSTAFPPQAEASEAAEAEQDDETEDMSMDVTAAVGGILPKKSSPGNGRRKSVVPSRRRSSVAKRQSSEGESTADDESMDLTTVGGAIIQQSHSLEQPVIVTDNTMISDEDMSMEFTNVVGGVLKNHAPSRRDPQFEAREDNETMEMTMAVGGILPPIEERTEPQTDGEDERTAKMDFTTAVGTILPPYLNPDAKSRAKELMEEEADVGQLSEFSAQNPRRPPSAIASPKPSTAPSLVATSIASETGSPSLALKPRLSGRNNGHTTTTPKIASKPSTPVKNAVDAHQRTPTKQLTPLPNHASTPNKTPILSNVTHRGASPKKLFKAEIKARASPASAHKSAAKQGKGLFDRNEQTGQHTPSVVLHAPKPHQHLRRRSSGLGVDQEGLGSPRIAELLDRRASIGDAATTFVPNAQKSGVLRFDDPRAIAEEIDAEREEEERRESGRFIMEQEADQMEPQEENATLQLKEMIESMTPKRLKPNKLRGRKSLHVGAAKGILGKRPAELDFESDEEGETTPKRLKAVSREASPVKQVHLPQPPSKDETTGRTTRVKLDEASGNATITPTLLQSPSKAPAASTPQPKGRFKDMPVHPAAARPTSFEDKLDNVLDAIDISATQPDGTQCQEAEQEKIPLQTFLNMTNIHFIELSTTKRRHTAAPVAPSRPSQDSQPASTESCFVAAATTLPLLELYQHATRELKSYISSGRRIIRSIEAETLEEQPALFREYVDARPDVKTIMDHQFRNGKTHARLLSKESWYAWRAQLVDGLKEGLEGICKGMEDDALQLTQQERVLESVLPGLLGRQAELVKEEHICRQRIEEVEGADREALRDARSNLMDIDIEVSRKQELLDMLQEQMRDKEETLLQAAELKDEFQSQIEEAERVREECRGWSPKSVLELKAKVETIEKETGWLLVTAEDDNDGASDSSVALTLRYKDSLRLFFYPSAFPHDSPQQKDKRHSRGRKTTLDSAPSVPISLTYSPLEAHGVPNSVDLPTEKRFFLQLLQSQLHAFAATPKGTVSAKTVLSTVSQGWQAAENVSEEIRLLNVAGITNVSILGDERLSVKTMVLLQGKSRVDIEFSLDAAIGSEGQTEMTSGVTAKAVYGSVVEWLTGAKSVKVHQALAKEIESKELGTGAWAGAVRGFEHWVAVQHQKVRGKQEGTDRERLPLSPRKVQSVQKKQVLMPVNQHKMQRQSASPQANSNALHKTQLEPAVAEEEKENVPGPSTGIEQWTPMTPIKRVGALRRSPIIGLNARL